MTYALHFMTMQPDDRAFWADLPPALHIALTEADAAVLGATVATGARLLERCHALGMPWPEIEFDVDAMILTWYGLMTEVIIENDALYIDDAVWGIVEDPMGVAGVVTYLDMRHQRL